MADARTWGQSKRVRVVCARRLPDGAPCDRKLDQGPPWQYETGGPDGIWMRFQCDRCGADYPLSRRQANGPFMAAWMAALQKPAGQREVRLPLTAAR